MLWFTGDRIASAYAQTVDVRGLKYPDIGQTMYRFAGGATATLETVWCMPERTPFDIDERMTIIGTDGFLHIQDTFPNLGIVSPDGFRSPDTTYWPEFDGVRGGALREEFSYFASCALAGAQPQIGRPEDAKEALAATLAAEESARTGEVVRRVRLSSGRGCLRGYDGQADERVLRPCRARALHERARGRDGRHGLPDQVMRHDIRPLYEGAAVAGRAATMLAGEVAEVPEEPFKLELELLDSIGPGEVVVCTTQGSTRAAMWGELLSTHTRARGGRGAIIDGLTRDAWGIQEMRFPVFVSGATPADSKGRLDVTAIRVPIRVGGVVVHDGDLVVGDVDGCLAVPQAIEAEVDRARARQGHRREHRSRRPRGRSEHPAGLQGARDPVNAP